MVDRTVQAVLQPHAARRLEVLSDIVFGLAMTLLASRLPIPTLPQPAPTWPGLTRLLAPHLLALGLSFSIAALFWFSHHRRLALTPRPTALEVIVNFAFLLVIMLLPATTDLYGRYGDAGSTQSIYAAVLALLSSLNLLLWILAIYSPRQNGIKRLPWRLVAAPAFGTLIFIPAAIIAMRQPIVAGWMLNAALLTPLVGRLASTGLIDPGGT